MMDFTPAVVYTPAEVEEARLDSLKEAVADRETTVDQLIADFAPGSFGCHEALQMASVFMDSVDRHLVEHPAVLAKPEWHALAHAASVALYNLYQAIGESHFDTNEPSPPEGRFPKTFTAKT